MDSVLTSKAECLLPTKECQDACNSCDTRMHATQNVLAMFKQQSGCISTPRLICHWLLHSKTNDTELPQLRSLPCSLWAAKQKESAYNNRNAQQAAYRQASCNRYTGPSQIGIWLSIQIFLAFKACTMCKGFESVRLPTFNL